MTSAKGPLTTDIRDIIRVSSELSNETSNSLVFLVSSLGGYPKKPDEPDKMPVSLTAQAEKLGCDEQLMTIVRNNFFKDLFSDETDSDNPMLKEVQSYAVYARFKYEDEYNLAKQSYERIQTNYENNMAVHDRRMKRIQYAINTRQVAPREEEIENELRQMVRKIGLDISWFVEVEKAANYIFAKNYLDEKNIPLSRLMEVDKLTLGEISSLISHLANIKNLIDFFFD